MADHSTINQDIKSSNQASNNFAQRGNGRERKVFMFHGHRKQIEHRGYSTQLIIMISRV
jgi:hypothetical protein